MWSPYCKRQQKSCWRFILPNTIMRAFKGSWETQTSKFQYEFVYLHGSLGSECDSMWKSSPCIGTHNLPLLSKWMSLFILGCIRCFLFKTALKSILLEKGHISTHNAIHQPSGWVPLVLWWEPGSDKLGNRYNDATYCMNWAPFIRLKAFIMIVCACVCPHACEWNNSKMRCCILVTTTFSRRLLRVWNKMSIGVHPSGTLLKPLNKRKLAYFCCLSLSSVEKSSIILCSVVILKIWCENPFHSCFVASWCKPSPSSSDSCLATLPFSSVVLIWSFFFWKAQNHFHLLLSLVLK